MGINFLILRAGGVTRAPGDRWMIQGPMNYIPPIQVKEVDQGNSQVIRWAAATLPYIIIIQVNPVYSGHLKGKQENWPL